VLRELAAALRAYGRLARSKEIDRDALKADVDHHLAEANEHQGAVTEILRADPAEPSDAWPLRGELVTHLDRLRNELSPAPPRLGGDRPATAKQSWFRPVRAAMSRWRKRSNSGPQ
jgi:hypothetical protein